MNTDELLNKYWEGETSLEEERLLKRFFTDENDTQAIFAAMQDAQKVKLNSAKFEKDFYARLRYRKQKRRVHTLYISALSMAAAVAFAVFVVTQTQQSEAFVVEHGVRQDNVEQAYNYADEALDEALMPLRQSMQSLAPIKGLEGSLAPSYTKQKGILDSNLINN